MRQIFAVIGMGLGDRTSWYISMRSVPCGQCDPIRLEEHLQTKIPRCFVCGRQSLRPPELRYCGYGRRHAGCYALRCGRRAMESGKDVFCREAAVHFSG